MQSSCGVAFGSGEAFVAGDGDISVPNQTWYGFQSFETCFYTPELHQAPVTAVSACLFLEPVTERGLLQSQALLAPSRTLSQILGLRGDERKLLRGLGFRSQGGLRFLSHTVSLDPRLTMPPWPELVAANSPKESPVQKVSPASDKLCRHLVMHIHSQTRWSGKAYLKAATSGTGYQLLLICIFSLGNYKKKS